MDENAKPEPVYSIDMLGANLVVTSGVDENMPPKGSARVRAEPSRTFPNLPHRLVIDSHCARLAVETDRGACVLPHRVQRPPVGRKRSQVLPLRQDARHRF